MHLVQEVVVEIDDEIRQHLLVNDTERLRNNRILSPIVKAIRCTFAEAMLGDFVDSFNDLSAEELLYLGGQADEVGRFMERAGLLPIGNAGASRIEDWHKRHVDKTGDGANTLLKIRVVLVCNQSWEQRAMRHHTQGGVS